MAAAVLSGNRNFEGRVNPLTRANYLASPPLVVAYAIAGRMDLDLTREPLGQDPQGKDVFLRDIWPSQQEVRDTIRTSVRTEHFRDQYASVFDGDDAFVVVAGGDAEPQRQGERGRPARLGADPRGPPGLLAGCC